MKEVNNWYRLQPNDKVTLNYMGLNWANLMPLSKFVNPKEVIFTVKSVKTDRSCQDNDLNCICDKFIDIEHEPSGVKLTQFVADELDIYDLK